MTKLSILRLVSSGAKHVGGVQWKEGDFPDSILAGREGDPLLLARAETRP
jgi:hypothetical protein